MTSETTIGQERRDDLVKVWRNPSGRTAWREGIPSTQQKQESQQSSALLHGLMTSYPAEMSSPSVFWIGGPGPEGRIGGVTYIGKAARGLHGMLRSERSNFPRVRIASFFCFSCFRG